MEAVIATRAGSLYKAKPYLELNSLKRLEPKSEDEVSAKQSINGYEVKYNLPKLKHDMQIQLEPVYVVFCSIESTKSFHINYCIYVDNIPNTVNGQLNMVVEKSLDADYS